MADGQYRFHQAGTGNFYHPQHNQQVFHARHLARNGSPVNGGRAGYNNETPSPSRSPVSQAASHTSFNIFNQGHQQGQHTMMNGGNGHQRFMQMNMQHKYQHQSHQAHHVQQTHHNQQNHAAQSAQVGSIGHQHNFSGGVASNPSGNFNSGGQQTGSPNEDNEDLGELIGEYWPEQQQRAAELRQATQSNHRHSRKPGAVSHTKGSLQPPSSESQRAGDGVEGHRVTMTADGDPEDWTGLDLSGQGLRSLSPRLFQGYTFLTRLFIDNNKLSALPHAIGQLRSLRHLDASRNQLKALPESIGMLVNLERLDVFDNNIRSIPFQVGHLHRLDFLGIDGNPFDEDLKEILAHQGTRALVMNMRDRTEVGLPPPEREIIELDSSDAADTFSVLDFNILCDRYANSSHYGYTPPKVLSWEYRRDLIVEEIKKRDADIVCLQEIDTESYNDFRRELAFSYKGVHWPKSRARTMADREARLVDGCAIFYRYQKYIILDKQLIEFANTAINRPDMKGEHDIFNRVMPRDDIAVVAFFENRMTGSRMMVANTHIYWNPVFTDAKMVQVAILMEQTTKFAERCASFPPCSDKSAFRHAEQDGEAEPENPELPPAQPAPSLEYSAGNQIPLILCGDFNSSEESGVYDLLDMGSVPSDHPDLGNRNYGNFTRDGISHPFALSSAYHDKDREKIGEERQLQFTNYTPDFSGFIDYIWYSSNLLRVRRLLGGIDIEYLEMVPGFPNFHFPSDHLALFAEFSVEPRKERPKPVEADFGPQKERRS